MAVFMEMYQRDAWCGYTCTCQGNWLLIGAINVRRLSASSSCTVCTVMPPDATTTHPLFCSQVISCAYENCSFLMTQASYLEGTLRPERHAPH